MVEFTNYITKIIKRANLDKSGTTRRVEIWRHCCHKRYLIAVLKMNDNASPKISKIVLYCKFNVHLKESSKCKRQTQQKLKSFNQKPTRNRILFIAFDLLCMRQPLKKITIEKLRRQQVKMRDKE